MRTEAAQRQLRKHARRYRRMARASTKDRDAAQAARADDQALLIGLWEQLDASHVEAFTTTCHFPS